MSMSFGAQMGPDADVGSGRSVGKMQRGRTTLVAHHPHRMKQFTFGQVNQTQHLPLRPTSEICQIIRKVSCRFELSA
jgi:hypothetical protein